eukprot:gnl/MRDRNA2_/MRDRNA2_29398_c0_seq1.p1 gnl/MRDRNA2_/MRDRNA2_29398_c0~~gnl/MRDRNA2_/MRDRNA2_29398_c0_seq1.p1  ORF type:complete len:331 (-),score=41.16 gnl/MRDRNA2_/MRDRNA2_29398_c0_seq1:165-1109(-)
MSGTSSGVQGYVQLESGSAGGAPRHRKLFWCVSCCLVSAGIVLVFFETASSGFQSSVDEDQSKGMNLASVLPGRVFHPFRIGGNEAAKWRQYARGAGGKPVDRFSEEDLKASEFDDTRRLDGRPAYKGAYKPGDWYWGLADKRDRILEERKRAERNRDPNDPTEPPAPRLNLAGEPLKPCRVLGEPTIGWMPEDGYCDLEVGLPPTFAGPIPQVCVAMNEDVYTYFAASEPGNACVDGLTWIGAAARDRVGLQGLKIRCDSTNLYVRLWMQNHYNQMTLLSTGRAIKVMDEICGEPPDWIKNGTRPQQRFMPMR